MAARVPLGELLPVLAAEATRRMLMLGATFAIIAISALAIGISLPRRYESSTTIVLQQGNAATALPGDHAIHAGTADLVARARELLSSRKVLNELVAADGTTEQRSAVEQDSMVEAIGNRIDIASRGEDRVRISYSDGDPARSLRITRQLGELFMRESLAAKERESRGTFDFIDRQAKGYQRKLTDAEDKLQSYRQATAGSAPAGDGNARVSRLHGQVEQARVELVEQRARESALVSQLSDPAEPSPVPTRDVPPGAAGAAHDAPYEALREKLAEARRESGAAAARVEEAEAALKVELGSADSAPAGNELAGVVRDYETIRGIYEDLLKRRENARMAMDLDASQQGLAFRVEQPAVMPQHPSGPRLAHFAIAGLLLAVLLPLAVLFGYARLDPRVRSAAQVERLTGLPMLATIPAYPTPADRRRTAMHATALALIMAGVMLCYAVTLVVQLEASP